MSSSKGKASASRKGRGSILLIVGLLMGSGVVRLGVGTSEAIASTFAGLTREDTSAVTEARALRDGGDGIARLLNALQARESAVEQREASLAFREKAVEIARQEIERRIAALETAEERLRSTLAIASTAAEDDLARLTTVYENMKPKNAAPLFEAMEPDFAAGFLGRMRPDAAAAIMAGISPGAAYSISAILAGRNAAAPKQ